MLFQALVVETEAIVFPEQHFQKITTTIGEDMVRSQLLFDTGQNGCTAALATIQKRNRVPVECFKSVSELT
jgi:hypothetical protein